MTPEEFRRALDLGIFSGRAVLLAEGQILERLADESNPQPIVFTRKEYYALWAADFFLDQRVQLIGGEIVQESPMNPHHVLCVRKATRTLERIFATGYDVRVQGPLNLAPISEPHPDLAVVTGTSTMLSVTFATDDGNPASTLSVTSGLAALPAGWPSSCGASFRSRVAS